jgi:hypothetical protein
VQTVALAIEKLATKITKIATKSRIISFFEK